MQKCGNSSGISIALQMAFVGAENPLRDRAILIVDALALVASHCLARLRNENLDVDVAVFHCLSSLGINSEPFYTST